MLSQVRRRWWPMPVRRQSIEIRMTRKQRMRDAFGAPIQPNKSIVKLARRSKTAPRPEQAAARTLTNSENHPNDWYPVTRRRREQDANSRDYRNAPTTIAAPP